MPHIVVESSSKTLANPRELLQRLVRALSDCETVDPAAVKGRFVEHSVWELGSGAPDEFVHVNVAIMEGRPDDLRRSMADQLYAVAKEYVERERGHKVVVTLELRDMDLPTYRK